MAGGKWAGRGDPHGGPGAGEAAQHERGSAGAPLAPDQDRKSTRLNSSHSQNSYAVFCLKKKKHRELYANCNMIRIPRTMSRALPCHHRAERQILIPMPRAASVD